MSDALNKTTGPIQPYQRPGSDPYATECAECGTHHPQATQCQPIHGLDVEGDFLIYGSGWAAYYFQGREATCQQGEPCGDTDNCPDPAGCGFADTPEAADLKGVFPISPEMTRAGEEALSKVFGQHAFAKHDIVHSIYWAMRAAEKDGR